MELGTKGKENHGKERNSISRTSARKVIFVN
jgi:hypothetical protein